MKGHTHIMKHLFILALLAGAEFSAAAAQFGASTPAQLGVSAAGGSFNPIFSADGRHLVFVSHANNLVTNDDLGLSLDVFVHDLVASNTVLVSVSTNHVGGANVDANYPSVSSNGQYIAFASRASNLVTGDTNDAGDIFLRDVKGVTVLVSADVNGNSPVDPAPSLNIPLSGYPQISSDGRWVFFESRATNLIATGAPLGSVNVYARDTWLRTTVLVSGDTNSNPVSGKCELGSITPDARFAAFSGTSGNFLAGTTNHDSSVYLWDMQVQKAIWAPVDCFGCDHPVIDSSGNIIAYFARATDGAGNVIYGDGVGIVRVNRMTVLTEGSRSLGGTTNISSPVLMSADGNVLLISELGYGPIVYEFRTSNAEGTNGVIGGAAAALSADGNFGVIQSTGQLIRVILTNYQVNFPNSFHVVSVATNGRSSSASFEFSSVAISPDGSLVAFDSPANDLVSGDLNGASDIFLRDMNSGVTELITKAQPAKPAGAAFTHSFLGLNSISADGRFVVTLRYDDPSAFRDTNGWHDVFVSDVVNGLSAIVSISSNVYVTNFDGGAQPTVFFIDNTRTHLINRSCTLHESV